MMVCNTFSPGTSTGGGTDTRLGKHGGARKGRYMIANSQPPGANQITVRPDPVLSPGPARALPKAPKEPRTLPTKHVPMTSHAWLRKYGLKALRLDLKTFLKDNAAVLPKVFGDDDGDAMDSGSKSLTLSEVLLVRLYVVTLHMYTRNKYMGTGLTLIG